MPQEYWYYLFLKKDNVWIFCQMLRLIGYVAMLHELTRTPEQKKYSEEPKVYANQCSR